MDLTKFLIAIGLILTGVIITYPIAFRRGQMHQLGLIGKPIRRNKHKGVKRYVAN